MVSKTYYATRDMRHPVYRTRMLKAGDEMEISGPLGPAFLKMGIITDKGPKKAAPKAEPKAEPVAPKAKRAPRRRKAKQTA